MKFVLITLTLTYLAIPASPLEKHGFGYKWDIFTNVLITSDIQSEVSNIRSNVECVSLCLMAEACVSVFYRKQHRRCQLHDVLFMSPTDGKEETGTIYFSLTTVACPPGYIHNRLINFCYQLHLDKIAYADGLADCSSRGEHLVTIDSPDKQSHFAKQVTASTGVQSLWTGGGLYKSNIEDNSSHVNLYERAGNVFQDGQNQNSKTYSYYIDGSDVASEGQWLYHDGRPVTYFPWAPGYPGNSSVNRDYLAASRAFEFRWQDRAPHETKYYACEKDI